MYLSYCIHCWLAQNGLQVVRTYRAFAMKNGNAFHSYILFQQVQYSYNLISVTFSSFWKISMNEPIQKAYFIS